MMLFAAWTPLTYDNHDGMPDHSRPLRRTKSGSDEEHRAHELRRYGIKQVLTDARTGMSRWAMVGRYPPVCDRITNAGGPIKDLGSGGPAVVGLLAR